MSIKQLVLTIYIFCLIDGSTENVIKILQKSFKIIFKILFSERHLMTVTIKA